MVEIQTKRDKYIIFQKYFRAVMCNLQKTGRVSEKIFGRDDYGEQLLRKNGENQSDNR